MSSTTIGPLIWPAARNFTAHAVTIIFSVVFVVGMIAVTLMDIVMGQSYFAIILGPRFLETVPMGWIVPWAFSIGGMAAQIGFWEWFMRGGRMKNTNGVMLIAVVASLVFLAFDTIADLGALTAFMDGPKAAIQVFPSEWTIGAAVAYGITFIATAFWPPITKLLIGEISKRSSGAHAAMD